MRGKEGEAVECRRNGKEDPDPLVMAARFAAFAAADAEALRGMVGERKYRHLLVWLGGWALFLTWPRYLICSRCEGYGKMCRSYYLGRYTSSVFPRVEGKRVGGAAVLLEVLCLSTIFWTPAIALRKNRVALSRYLALMQTVLLGQFFHACRWCGTHSHEGWKAVCPAHRYWKSRAGRACPAPD